MELLYRNTKTLNYLQNSLLALISTESHDLALPLHLIQQIHQIERINLQLPILILIEEHQIILLLVNKIGLQYLIDQFLGNLGRIRHIGQIQRSLLNLLPASGDLNRVVHDLEALELQVQFV